MKLTNTELKILIAALKGAHTMTTEVVDELFGHEGAGRVEARLDRLEGLTAKLEAAYQYADVDLRL